MILSSLCLPLAGKGGGSISFLRKPYLRKGKAGCCLAGEHRLANSFDMHRSQCHPTHTQCHGALFPKGKDQSLLAHPPKAQNNSSQYAWPWVLRRASQTERTDKEDAFRHIFVFNHKGPNMPLRSFPTPKCFTV